MGLGVSGSTAIIFLGVLIAAGALYTATSNASENVLEAQDADTERALERTNTDIAVTNAAYNTSNTSLTVNLTSVGPETLSVSETTLLIDSAYVDAPLANASVDGDAGTDLWYADENLSFVVNADPTPKRVKVVTGSGVAATEAVSQIADISVPSLTLFIASIVVTAGVSGVLIDTVADINSSLDERGGDVSTETRTDIEAISDPQTGAYDDESGNLSIYVKNTGFRTLPAASGGFDTIVGGRYQTNITVNVVDGTEWRPSNVTELTVTDIALSSGDYRMTIVVDGNEEVFEFCVP